MDEKRGFTLVELLVVIAIIALLMSILMPALSRVRKQAKAVICQSNLKQWSLVFSMYTGDNDGYFMNGRVRTDSPYWWAGGNGGGMGSWWFLILQPYYKDEEILLCPMAVKPYDEGGRAPFAAWRTSFGHTGSYGVNGYIINSPPGLDEQLGRPTKDNWRTSLVNGAADIPLILDALWVDGWPEHFDSPAVVEDWWDDQIGESEMRRFCANRHNEYVNCVFFDFSVRKIGLKELWKLKWHRKFDTSGWSGGWPEWMKDFKDY